MASFHGKQQIPASATHYRHGLPYYGNSIHAYAFAGTNRVTAVPLCGANDERVHMPTRGQCAEVTCKVCAKMIRMAGLQPLDF